MTRKEISEFYAEFMYTRSMADVIDLKELVEKHGGLPVRIGNDTYIIKCTISEENQFGYKKK
jgi:hypothetical protein